MADLELMVGYRKVGPGRQIARGGNTGELMVLQAHGSYYEAAVAGRIMEGMNLVTGVAPGTALTTTPPICLWNPPSSGKNLAVFKLACHYVSGTLGSGIIYHGFVAAQTTVPSTGTEIVPVCTLIGAPRGVGRMFTGSTLVSAMTPFRGLMTMSPMLATTVFPTTLCEAFMDDAIVVPPGGVYAIQMIGGAGTSPLVTFSIAYEECDLIQ
jgi:hypothetical protein